MTNKMADSYDFWPRLGRTCAFVACIAMSVSAPPILVVLIAAMVLR